MWKGGKELKCEPKEVFTNTSLAAALSLLHPLLPSPAVPMAQPVLSTKDSGIVEREREQEQGCTEVHREMAERRDEA